MGKWWESVVREMWKGEMTMGAEIGANGAEGVNQRLHMCIPSYY